MSLLRKALILPPVIAGAAVLVYAVSGREAPKRTDIGETTTLVRVVTVEPQDFVPRVTGYGTVDPAHTLDAIAQVSGRVTYINPDFKRGEFIPEGKILVTLAPEDYELEIARRRAISPVPRWISKSWPLPWIHRNNPWRLPNRSSTWNSVSWPG